MIVQHLNVVFDFSTRENLLNTIKTNGELKWRDKSTMSPYIMAHWTLEEMVEEGLLTKEHRVEGHFFFRKKYIVYRLK
jgi:hypothetical protein